MAPNPCIEQPGGRQAIQTGKQRHLLHLETSALLTDRRVAGALT